MASRFGHAGHAILPLPISVVPAREDPKGQGAPGDSSVITWFDSANHKRSIVVGAYLSRYDFLFNDGEREVHRTVDADLDTLQGGFGYLVSHSAKGNSPIGRDMPAQVETFFLGEHHVIHRVRLNYLRDWEAGGHGIEIPVVIDWFVATGRDHPIWAVTWKISDAINPEGIDFDQDDYRMDVRAPYGALNFDGGEGGVIGGVAWGDYQFRFRTTTEPLTLNSEWRYRSSNWVNFVQAWMEGTINAEMGIVQTRVADEEMGNPDRVKDSERHHAWNEDYEKKPTPLNPTCGDELESYVMPCIYGWPYQLMNNDWELQWQDDGTYGHKPLDEPTSTKLVAWGTPYGWLGASKFQTFKTSKDDLLNTSSDGRGHRSYAMFVVVGQKARKSGPGGRWTADGDVDRAINAVIALNDGEISSVTIGSVLQTVKSGPDSSKDKDTPVVGGTHNGYDDTYAAYRLSAENNRVAFTFQPTMGPVRNPIFVIHGFAANAPTVMVGNAGSAVDALAVNAGAASGALVSINADARELWVTLVAEIKQAIRIEISG